jgi:hypothetical protein
LGGRSRGARHVAAVDSDVVSALEQPTADTRFCIVITSCQANSATTRVAMLAARKKR